MGLAVDRIGLEMSPPPTPLTSLDDPSWSERWSEAEPIAHRLGVVFRPPHLVPWTRKAHELHHFALEKERGAEIRSAIFQAYLLEGRDIGRVDELVRLAVGAGLDRTEAKASLDVDRLEQDVVAVREDAARSGVDQVPTLVAPGGTVRGFRMEEDLGTLLRYR